MGRPRSRLRELVFSQVHPASPTSSSYAPSFPRPIITRSLARPANPSMPRFTSAPAGLLWPGLPLLYLLLPGHPLALVNGLPLSNLALGAGLLLLLAALCHRP